MAKGMGKPVKGSKMKPPIDKKPKAPANGYGKAKNQQDFEKLAGKP